MNFAIVLSVLGKILLIESIGMMLPLMVAVYFGQNDIIALLLGILITLFAGTLFVVLSKPLRRKMILMDPRYEKTSIRIKESFAIVTLGWVLISVFGSLPFVISGYIPNFIDAFFETVSGFTTTGATILTDIEALPKGLLFWRSFTHWFGGMGIIVFSVAILPAMGIGSFQIFKAESPGPVAGRLVPKIKDTAKVLYITYIVITLTEILLLKLGNLSLYEAVIHTFGTVGTGGFSSRNASIAAFDSTYINIVISIFMVLSGISFSLYYMIYSGKLKDVLRDQELRAFFVIITVSTVLIALNIHTSVYKNLGESFEHAFFQVASLLSTTGYVTSNFENWPTFSKLILHVLMFIGGSAGSTGGAIKVIRILVIFKLIKREFIRTVHPRAIMPLKIGSSTINSDMLYGITGFVFLYFLLMFAGALLLSLEGISMTSAFSASAASIGNIGPGFEIVGAVENYAVFSSPSKILMTGLMLIGRLEIFTVLILFNKKIWTDEI